MKEKTTDCYLKTIQHNLELKSELTGKIANYLFFMWSKKKYIIKTWYKKATMELPGRMWSTSMDHRSEVTNKSTERRSLKVIIMLLPYAKRVKYALPHNVCPFKFCTMRRSRGTANHWVVWINYVCFLIEYRVVFTVLVCHKSADLRLFTRIVVW